MKITVLGTGYVGLVTGTCLAESGNEVVCVDSDSRTIEALRSRGLATFERARVESVERNVQGGQLRLTSDLREAVRESEIILIAVGTPQLRGESVALSDAIGGAMKMLQAVYAVNENHSRTNRQKIDARLQSPFGSGVVAPEPQAAIGLPPNSMW